MSIRRRLIAGSIILIIAAIVICMASMYLLAYRPLLQELTSLEMRRASESVADPVQTIFTRVAAIAARDQDWGITGVINLDDVNQLNKLIAPLFKGDIGVASSAVAEDTGREVLVISSADGGWRDRLTDPDVSGRQAHFMTWSRQGELIGSEQKEVDYDARRRPWFMAVMARPSDAGIYWTPPFRYVSTQQLGISAVVRWKAPDGHRYAMTLDITLLNLTGFTQQSSFAKSGLTAVLTESGAVLAVPRDARFATGSAIDAALLEPVDRLAIAPLTAAFSTWAAGGRPETSLLKFEVDGASWLTMFYPVKLGNQTFWIATLASTADFGDLSGATAALLAVIILGSILIASLGAMWYGGQLSGPIERLTAASARLGRMELRQPIDVRSSVREIDVLARSFETMRVGLTTALAELVAKTQELERHSADLEVAKSELAAVIEFSNSGIIVVDLDGMVTAWNEGATKIYGYSGQETIGQPIAMIASPEPRVGVRDRLESIALTREPTTQEVVRIRKDGRRIDVLQTLSPIRDRDGNIVGASAIILDITERKQAERALHRTTRALETLSRGNEALVRANDQEGLFDEMCRAIVEIGGYRMAWIGIAEMDSGKTVRVAASAGNTDGYLESAAITWSDTGRGHGPTGMAIRTGAVQINQDFENDPAMAAWRREALSRGYRSSIALPLRENEEVVGALTIYASEGDAFGPDETQLLTELANDVSFGLASLKARSAEQLLSRGFESISDGIAIYDINDRLVWTNGRLRTLFVSDWTEAHGKTFEELVRIDLSKGLYIEAAGREEEFVQQRLAAHRQSGRSFLYGTSGGRWIQARDDHMPDGNIVAVRTDVTSLVEADERFRGLADNLPGIVFRRMVRPNGETREIYVSAGVRRILGVDPEEFTSGRTKLLDFLHPDEREKKSALVKESMTSMTPLVIQAERYIGRNGAVRWWQIYAKPRRLLDGSTQFDGIALDITEQRSVEDQLRRAQRLEALGQLTSGISHDFNNLLAVIIGTLDLAMDHAGKEGDLKGLIRTASESAVRGSELTKRLLAFSRGQALSPELVDLNRNLPDLRKILGPALGPHIKIDLQLGQNLWPCLIDPSQMDDIVLNLAINARDAMPEGGRLIIQTGNAHIDKGSVDGIAQVDPGDYVLLSVGDTGQGMPREVLEHVFEPFFTTKGPGKGTGLGLSQVYGFVTQSKGHVTIDSEVGRGTTVRIYLPRA